jgi:hypothetical protein
MKGELMLKKGNDRAMRRWRAVALLTAGLAIGVTMMATPAASHVGGTVGHLWNDHIKPRGDARYLRYNSTLRPGQAISGTFGAAGGSGFAFTEIDFHPKLPASITEAQAHYLTTGATSAECPGPGQAAAGHLCAYEAYASAVTFGDFTDPYSSTVGVKPIGTVLWWSVSSSSSYVRGSWTARAPLAAASVSSLRSGGDSSPSPAR